MAGLAGFLVVLGIGSLLLPLIDMQFTILAPIDPYQPWAGLAIAAIGIVILALPRLRGQASRSESNAPAPADGEPTT
jgi:hypothetical protein